MVNGLPSGKGKFEHLLLNIKIDGEFQNGVPSGMVKYFEFTRKNDLKRYYEGRFLDGKPIGEGIEILFSEGDTSIYYKGGIYPFDSISAFFKYPGFNFIDTVRFGAVGLGASGALLSLDKTF